MKYTTLVQTHELAKHPGGPSWVIVDCRFDLQNTGLGFEMYQQAHIPGAVYAHMDRDLSGPKTSSTGRHPLPEPEAFIQTLSSWGIDSTKQVVVYDAAGGSYAVRLWWMLRFFGHEAVALLNGGLPLWEREGRPLASGVETNPPAVFTGQMHPEMLVTTEEVEQIRLNPAYKLVDARSAERFHGEVEPIDPVAGHIPGALNRFHGKNLGAHGTFKPADQLRQEFQNLIGETAPGNVVVYCGSGVTSIHHLLAMELAGLPGARLYPGSWSQWIRDPGRPVATEDD